MTDKLSYDIISCIALMDHVKRAADRYIGNENQIANATVNSVEPSNILVTDDINEMVSDLGVILSDLYSPIVASGCSGFETLTGLANPTGLGNLTAVLQVQGGGGGNISSEEDVTNSLLNIEFCVTAPSLVPIPSDRRAPSFVQFDSFDGTTYF